MKEFLIKIKSLESMKFNTETSCKMLGECLENSTKIKISLQEKERQVHTSGEGDVTAGNTAGVATFGQVRSR